MQLGKNLAIKINKEAKEYIEFASEQCRLIYNFALAEQIAYYEQNQKGLSIFEQKKELPNLKKQFPDYVKVYNKCLSQMYFRLKEAFQRFFNKQTKLDKKSKLDKKVKGSKRWNKLNKTYIKRICRIAKV